MKCTTLECESLAIAVTSTGAPRCLECAWRVQKVSGPDALEPIEGAKFPWEHPVTGTCPHCSTPYNDYILDRSGKCPNCKRRMNEAAFVAGKHIDPELDVKYEEGQGHD